MYNILVVDDERIHREGIIMLLEKYARTICCGKHQMVRKQWKS